MKKEMNGKERWPNPALDIIIITLIVVFLFFAFTSCKKSSSSSATPNLQMVTDNLVSPLTLVEAPDNSQRLFIVDQVGKIWIIAKDGTKLSTPFIDISSKLVALQSAYDERGLLGLAFHPDYKTNGKFYLFYTAPPRAGGPAPGATWSSLTRISEFKVSSGDANVADVSSERVLVEADHPYLNHNGGTLAFGPDGYLYFAIGDGGYKDDDSIGHVSDWYAANKGGNAQNITANLMGKMMRIDVNSGSPYSIPPDNPYIGSPMPEIYAYGFRNPYRFSFDMGGTHQIYLSDAGQSLYEEINLVKKGGNYGWNVKEGIVCFNTDNDLLTRSSCPSVDSMGNPLIDPIIQLPNHANPSGGIATVIIGGYVYRGNALSDLSGKYVFGIFSQDGNANAKIYSATYSTGLWPYQEIALKDYTNNIGAYLKGFGQDLSGEIYLMTSTQQGPSGSTGKVYKLVASK